MLENVVKNVASPLDPTTNAVTKDYLLSEPGLAQLHQKLGDNKVACIILDVAGVGIANEYLGRDVVNAYLKTLVSELQEMFPEGEVVRWGGDEFLLIVPVGAASPEAQLIERIAALKGPESITKDILREVAAGVEENLHTAEIMSALKTHQRALSDEYFKNHNNYSLQEFRDYCEVDERQERISTPKVLTLYAGSWEYLGTSPSAASIAAAVNESDKALNDAKLGRDAARHFGNSDHLELAASSLPSPQRGAEYVDLAISNPELGFNVLRLSNVLDLPAQHVISPDTTSCLTINMRSFGAINNNMGPETADHLLGKVAQRVFEGYGEPRPVMMRSSGGELMAFSDKRFSTSELQNLGQSLVEEVRLIVDPKEPEKISTANAAVIGAAIQNEIRHFQRTDKTAPDLTTEGLGDVFISQVETQPPSDGTTLDAYVSANKVLAHTNAGHSVFHPRDISEHVIYTDYHARIDRDRKEL